MPARPATGLVLTTMVAGWFLCSAVNTAGVKAGLTLLKPRSCGFSLTAMQFTAAALFQAALAAATGRLRPLPPGSLVEVSRIACAYTLGFLTLNLAMGLLAASFAETVRGLEPLFSFGLVRLCGGRGGALSLAAGGALATLLVGAALACGAQPNFSRAGLALGMLSNFCFACRSLLTTRMQARCAAQFHAILRCAILRRAIRRRSAAAALCASGRAARLTRRRRNRRPHALPPPTPARPCARATRRPRRRGTWLRAARVARPRPRRTAAGPQRSRILRVRPHYSRDPSPPPPPLCA
jgi:hypothetical protein